MKNVNKNANHMLMTTHDSYLVHHCFSNFTLDGDTPFTIEAEFVYQDCNHGSFYSQQNGLDLGLKNSLPYFSHPSLGNLYAPNTLTLDRSCCYFIAVVYNKNSLKMYVNGYEIASANAQKPGAKNTDDFYIGKEFNGFISGVRVLSRAMTAQEIMTESGQGFQENTACELWTDFSGRGYRDISKNAMQLWRTGHDANCVNVANCTALYRNGLYVRTNGLDYDSAFSLTGKIYPDISPGGDFNIYTLYGDGEAYLRLYLANKDGSCYLTADIGGKVLTSQTKVQGMMWTDYALTVDIKNGGVRLYQDGVKCAEGTCTGLKAFTNAKATVGGKNFTSKPDDSESFNGMLDYCAEFNRVLTDKEVDQYAEDQPYLYADGLSALMYFGWGEAEDIFGNVPLAQYGKGYFTMAAGTNKITDPVGLNWYIPEDGKEYWNSLSEYDRWDFRTKISIIQEIVGDLTGIPMKSGSSGFQRPLSKPMEAMLRGLPAIESGEDEEFAKKLVYTCIGVAGALVIGYGGFKLAGYLAARYAAGGTMLRWLVTNWKKAYAIYAAVVVAVAAAIILIGDEAQPDRPENDHANLHVKSALWNHNGKPENGSIHFHNGENQFAGPASMKFEPADSSIHLYGVFIPSKLNKVDVDIEVNNTGTKDFSGEIVLKNGAGKQIGKSSSVVIRTNSTKAVSLSIDASSFKMPGFGRTQDWFQIKCVESGQETYLIRCDYTIYTLLGEPISPWNNEQREYNVKTPGYINTRLLDACLDILKIGLDKAVDSKELIGKIINGMSNCGNLEYNKEGWGGSRFTAIGYSFKFKKFINALYSTTLDDKLLNCVDCAVIVSSLCAMHGADYPMAVLDNPAGFMCNEVQLISFKDSKWEVPFGGRFRFHMVNRSNEDGFSCQTKIYDACLKVDGGSYPGLPESEGKKKAAEQPLGMNACETSDAVVHVKPEKEYNKEIYRERLVANGQNASFSYSKYYVGEISPALDITKDNMKLRASWIEQVFGSNKHISQLTLIDDMYGELDWKFTYDGEAMEICCSMVKSREDPKKAVEEVVNCYTYPNQEDASDSYPGSCCYKVTEQVYILWKDGTVYRINGTHAKAVADYIYQA